MYTREKDGIIYIYRNQELFLHSMKKRNTDGYHNHMMYLQSADYALQILPDEPAFAQIIKDRSGTFSAYSHKLEKILKIIAILLEDPEKIV